MADNENEHEGELEGVIMGQYLPVPEESEVGMVEALMETMRVKIAEVQKEHNASNLVLAHLACYMMTHIVINGVYGLTKEVGGSVIIQTTNTALASMLHNLNEMHAGTLVVQAPERMQ